MVNLTKMAILMVLLSVVLSGCAVNSAAAASDNPSQVSSKGESVSTMATSTEGTQPTTTSGQASSNQAVLKAVSNPDSVSHSSGTTVISVAILAEIHRLNGVLRNELEKSLDTIEKEQASHAVTTAEKSIAKSNLATTTASMQELAQQLVDIRRIISGDHQHGPVFDGPVEEPLHRQFPPLPKLDQTPKKLLPLAPSQGDEKEGGSQQRFPADGSYDESIYVEPIPPSKPSRPLPKLTESVEVLEGVTIESPRQVAPLPLTLNINVNPSFRDIGGNAKVTDSGVVRGSGNSAGGDSVIESPVAVIPVEDEEELPPVTRQVPVRILPRSPSSPSGKATTTTTAILLKSTGPTPVSEVGQKAGAPGTITSRTPKAAAPTRATTSSQKGETPKQTTKSAAATTSTTTKPNTSKAKVTSAPATAPTTTKATPVAKRHRRQQVENDEPHMTRSNPRRGDSIAPTKTGTSPCDWLKQYPELEFEIQKLGIELGKRKALNKRADDVERRIELLRAKVK